MSPKNNEKNENNNSRNEGGICSAVALKDNRISILQRSP